MSHAMSKVRSLNPIYVIRLHNPCFFSSSALSKEKTPSKSPVPKQQTVTETKNPLLNEIIGILGTENFINVTDSPEVSNNISEDTIMDVLIENKGSNYCTQRVRQNAHESLREQAETSAGGGVHVGNPDGIDNSSIVHTITETVRAENAGISIEERLDGLELELDSDIVGKVLKRCFKVPNKAMKFFNWVKLRNPSCCTTETYNTMFYIAGEAREFELVEKLVDEMKKSNLERNMKTWSILIKHYGKAKLIGKALLTFEEMRRSGFQPDAEAYKSMIRLLCDARKSDVAMEFYKEMTEKDWWLDAGMYKLLLSCLAHAGVVDGVHSIADDMVKACEASHHDVYACVLKSFCISGKINEALELIRDLRNKNVTISAEYFEILVKGLCRAKRIDDAIEIVEIMKKRGIVSEHVFGITINGYLRINDISKALDLFHSMKASGIFPTATTYTELMQHLFSVNKYEEGCALFDEMLHSGVKLDSLAFMAMVAGHIRQHRVSKAWDVFVSMEGKGIMPTQKAYSIFIKELCKTSSTHEIIKVLSKMQESKMVIRDEIFHIVISHLEKKGESLKLEQVREMQRQYRLYPLEDQASGKDDALREEGMLHRGSSNHTEPKTDLSLLQLLLPRAFDDEDLHKVCTILSSPKDWSAMQEDLAKLRIDYTPALVVEILRSCSLQGHVALLFFSWVGKQSGYSHTTETYNMAIKIAGRGKDFKHMRSLFYEMNRNGHPITSDTWTIMIMLYGRVGLTDIALSNFTEMKASGLKPAASTYKYLILSLCGRKGRKVDEAIKLFHEMIRTGLVPDRELAEGYIDCLCQTGKLMDARICIKSLCKVGFTTPLCYSMLIRALCRGGKSDEALSLVDEVDREDRPVLDEYVYGSLVHALLKMGQTEDALAKIDTMKRAGINPNVHVYTSLLVHFFKDKQTARALDMFKKMLDEGCQPTIVTYCALIRGLMSIGNYVEAQNLFRRIKLKGPFPDFKTYSIYITSLCAVGKSEEALGLLSEMLDDGIVPSSVNFRTVFFGLNREGKQDVARSVLEQKAALLNRRKFIKL